MDGVVKLGKENYFCSKIFNKGNALVSDRVTNKYTDRNMRYGNIIRTMVAAVAMMCAWQEAGAVKALLVPHYFKQSDGSVLKVMLNGDERHHYYTTDDNLVVEQHDNGDFCYAQSSVLAHDKDSRKGDEKLFVAQRNTSLQPVAVGNGGGRRAASAAKKAVRRKTTMGAQKVLVLLVSFDDKDFSMSDPKAAYEAQLNTDTWSARNYFLEQSSGKYQPTFVVLGPIKMDKKYSYYGQNDRYGDDKYPGEMVVEACKKVDGMVNFADYDYDHDGYVDQVFVIYAWKGEATSGIKGTIWPHQWTLTDANGEALTLDGVKIDSYACTNELDSDGSVCGVGTFCHEFSHCLGLPDFYYSSNFCMDVWSVMDYGNYNNDSKTPCNYTAYERWFMGWLDIDEPEANATCELSTLSAGGKAYRVQSPYNANEYYLLENKQQVGWDAYLPAHGMMVTHVDYDSTAWADNTVNSNSSRPNMTIVPADNKLSTSTLEGDLFPNGGANTQLTDNTTPAAKLNDGHKMGKPITCIDETDGIITFKYCRKLEIPVQNPKAELTDSTFAVSWQPCAEASEYAVNVLGDNGFDRLIEHITDTCVVVSGLKKGATYRWRVRSVYPDGMKSAYSAELEVTVNGAGVNGIVADDAFRLNGNALTVKDGVVATVFDTMGRTVGELRGGSVALARGVYVVKTGGIAVKIAVR